MKKLKFSATPEVSMELTRVLKNKSTRDLENMKMALELILKAFRSREDYLRLKSVKEELRWRYSASGEKLTGTSER